MTWVDQTAGQAVQQLGEYGPLGVLCMFMALGMFFMGVVIIILWKEVKSERRAHSATTERVEGILIKTINTVNELRAVFDSQVEVVERLGAPKPRGRQ